MPYRNTYGFPPYDPEKPMGGWTAEEWQRYRQQQTYRAPNKSERQRRNAARSQAKRERAIAAIDATLARNPVAPAAAAAPDNGNPALAGRKSGAQIRREMQLERRARLQAQRDRLAADSKRAPARTGTNIEEQRARRTYPNQPTGAANTTSAPTNQVPAGPPRAATSPTAMDGGQMTVAQQRANGILPAAPATPTRTNQARPPAQGGQVKSPTTVATTGAPAAKTKGAPAAPRYNPLPVAQAKGARPPAQGGQVKSPTTVATTDQRSAYARIQQESPNRPGQKGKAFSGKGKLPAPPPKKK